MDTPREGGTSPACVDNAFVYGQGHKGTGPSSPDEAGCLAPGPYLRENHGENHWWFEAGEASRFYRMSKQHTVPGPIGCLLAQDPTRLTHRRGGRE